MILDSSTLRDALRFLGGAVDKRAAVPILGHVLWKPTDSGVTLMATDGQSFATVDLEGGDAGEAVAIPFSRLHGLASAAAGEIRIHGRPGAAAASWGNGEATVGCMRAADFPTPDIPSLGWQPAGGVAESIAAVLGAADAEDGLMAGVALWPGQAVAAGTEASVFVRGSLDATGDPIYLGTKSAQLLAGVEAEELALASGWFCLRSPGRMVATRTLDPSGPHVNGAILKVAKAAAEREVSAALLVSREELLHAVVSVSTISGSDRPDHPPLVILRADDKGAKVSCRSGYAETTVKIDGATESKGESVRFGVSNHYFAAFLRSVADEEVRIEFGGHNKPAYMQSGEDHRVLAARILPEGE